MMNTLLLDTHFTLSRFPHYLRLKNLDIFSPKVAIDFSTAHYQIKTIDSTPELFEVLKLRFNVFYAEFASRRPRTFLRYDVDLYDFFCDHLIVKCLLTGKIVASYRLLTSDLREKTGSYYSESEFDLSELMKLPGNKLELGRACVHRAYRNGAVISLLWKGLYSYASRAQTRYMFGCSSINRKDFSSVGASLKYIDEKDYFSDLAMPVKEKYRHDFTFVDTGEKSPGPLLNMYLMAGAKLGRELAWDREMDCLDMLTVLDFQKIPQAFVRRFS